MCPRMRVPLSLAPPLMLMLLLGTLSQIDWSTWESTIQRPGLVAAFKAAHQSVPVLKCESPFTSELESGFAKLVRSPLSFCAIARLSVPFTRDERILQWVFVRRCFARPRFLMALHQ